MLSRRISSICERSFSTNFKSSENIIQLWTRVLAGVHVPTEAQEETLKNLVATGISLNRGRHQNLLPDELSSWLRHYYSTLDFQDKHRFFQSLATNCSLDIDEIDEAIGHWETIKARAAPGGIQCNDEGAIRAAERLFQASQPLYTRLWSPLAQKSDGLSFLVDLRGDLLKSIDKNPTGAAPLRAMAENLRRTLAGWFSVGLLKLIRINWDSSARMLEKIAAEEKVHSIDSWPSLKQRLGANKRVFAFTHPSLPGEPLVALYVALEPRLPATMDEILLEDDEIEDVNNGSNTEEAEEQQQQQPSAAVFYSISNMKDGLSGVDLGNNLIKRAVKELAVEVPNLTVFGTLSPIPGFASWLQVKLAKAIDTPLLLPGERKQLLSALRNSSALPDAELLQKALKIEDWIEIPALEEALRQPLLRLAACYLVQEKHRARALDAVANFHLRNGACIYRLNWKADLSAAGMKRSYGLMVNYLYDLKKVEENNRQYVIDGNIAVSEEVTQLLAG